MRSLSSRDTRDSRATRCPNCGKRGLVPADDITSEIEGYTFVERGLRCGACGEEFIPEEESQRMIRVARRLGIWGEPLKLRRKLSRSGRGTVLRIPTDIIIELSHEQKPDRSQPPARDQRWTPIPARPQKVSGGTIGP